MTDEDRPTARRSGNYDPSTGAPGFDHSPARFRATHASDRFSGASGVLFEQAMAQTRMAICLCDPQREDLPIVFANRAFRELTGYDEDEILGRNCRFLQGPRTSRESVARLRAAIEAEEVVVIELLNYRKDGTPFWNALHIGPIYDDQEQLIYYFGSQWDVSDVHAARAEEQHALAMARELSHRTKNMFAIISGIVNVTGRVRGETALSEEINERIRALARAYETTLEDAALGRIALLPSITAILDPVDTEGRLTIRGEPVSVSFSHVSMIGLILHELAMASLRGGALSLKQGGQVLVDWQEDGSGNLELRWQESGMPADAPDTGTRDGPSERGSQEVMARLLKVSRGTIGHRRNRDGVQTVISLPIREE